MARNTAVTQKPDASKKKAPPYEKNLALSVSLSDAASSHGLLSGFLLLAYVRSSDCL